MTIKKHYKRSALIRTSEGDLLVGIQGKLPAITKVLFRPESLRFRSADGSKSQEILVRIPKHCCDKELSMMNLKYASDHWNVNLVPQDTPNPEIIEYSIEISQKPGRLEANSLEFLTLDTGCEQIVIQLIRD